MPEPPARLTDATARAPGSDPGDEIVDLVDPSNHVIGQARRRDVRSRNLLHRGVGIICWNSRDEVYVHRRTRIKDVFPGMYDMFVGGVVGSGEADEDAARREIREELGIDGPRPKYLFHHLYQGPHNRAWVAVYEVEWDGPIHHQASEVEWGTFLTLDALNLKLNEWQFVPDGLEIFERLYRQESRQSRLGSVPGFAKGGDGGLPPVKR
jgi:8-oxo-dGTP pyrophosphatase MutT (NUDIX family)